MSTLHFPQGGLCPLTAHTPGTLLRFQGPPPKALLSANLSLISVGISCSLLGAQRASVHTLVIVLLTQERLASDGLNHIEIWPPQPQTNQLNQNSWEESRILGVVKATRVFLKRGVSD